MKKLSLFILGIYLSLSALGQSAREVKLPRVDQRVELLSIVFRLAGNPEYNTTDNVNYVKQIHQHFDQFTDHPLIKFAKSLRDSSGIGYDAVMSMAVHLKQPPLLDAVGAFSGGLPDKRWNVATSEKFVSLLKQFYKDAGCNAFFKAQASAYATAEERFLELFKKLDVNWYYKFFGKSPDESFNIIIGLGNGGSNYGPHLNLPGQQKKVYAIIGSGTFDSTGAPVYGIASYLPTLIHEFNHSFINYLGDDYEQQLRGPGEIIYKKEAAKMGRQAYGEWKTMMNEALVRAAVIRYLYAHETDTLIADKELKQQLARGFVWMRPLVNLLGQYEKQRASYPSLESFMPQIVKFYAGVAPNINTYDNDYLRHCAQLLSVEPFKKGDSSVNAGITEITFNFDKRLDGVRYFFGPGKKGAGHYPKPLGFRFANDNKSIVMKVALQPNTEYQVSIAGSMMRTDDGYAVQNTMVEFKTGEAH